MTRLPIEAFEQAARSLAKTRGWAPDELSFYGAKGDAAQHKRPKWVNLAEELRAHYERDQALDESNL